MHSIYHKRMLFIVLFTTFFGVVSWAYFYFTFFNFFVVQEDEYVLDHSEKIIMVAAASWEASIPKKGIKITTNKYTFDNYQSQIDGYTHYELTHKDETYSLILLSQPIISLRIIDFQEEVLSQTMTWEIKAIGKENYLGYGRLVKKVVLLDGYDIELALFQDEIMKKPFASDLFETHSHELHFTSKSSAKSTNLTALKDGGIPVFINGELHGVYDLKE
jgi:hypothetical protein